MTDLLSNVTVLYRGMRDPRIKWYVKLLSFLIVAYIVSPIDLIPDFIPVLGVLDEIILVPIAISLVSRMIPSEIYNDLNSRGQTSRVDKKIIYIGGIIVVSLWLFFLGLVYYLWK